MFTSTYKGAKKDPAGAGSDTYICNYPRTISSSQATRPPSIAIAMGRASQTGEPVRRARDVAQCHTDSPNRASPTEPVK